MDIGITLKETHHGNPGEKRILPAGITVGIETADNLPADSKIKYWAYPVTGYLWPACTKIWAKTVGVGLHADDVQILP